MTAAHVTREKKASIKGMVYFPACCLCGSAEHVQRAIWVDTSGHLVGEDDAAPPWCDACQEEAE